MHVQSQLINSNPEHKKATHDLAELSDLVVHNYGVDSSLREHCRVHHHALIAKTLCEGPVLFV